MQKNLVYSIILRSVMNTEAAALPNQFIAIDSRLNCGSSRTLSNTLTSSDYSLYTPGLYYESVCFYTPLALFQCHKMLNYGP